MAFNLVILTGRLTRDPELKYGASGTAYCKFTLAVNRMKKDDPADFIFCSAFGKTAELIGEHFRKGSALGLQGRIQQETYEKDGQKISKTGVTIDKIEFLESKKEEETQTNTTNKNGRYDNKPPKDLIKEESKPDIKFDDDSLDEFPF